MKSKVILSIAAFALACAGTAQAQQKPAAAKKPNILVIFGDDVGVTNISAYSDGLMATRPQHRPHREGGHPLPALLRRTELHRRPRGVPHRQHGLRTGLTKVAFPARPWHEPARSLDRRIMKNLGYATGQFGKNHVGDRNPSLPTVNGFDEFFGNLYHLNAEEEPELPDYPKDPAYLAKFGPRGVLLTKATNKDDPTVDPRFGRIGMQTIQDTGALTKKRMETIDDETSAAAIDFMKRQVAAASRSSPG